MSLFTFCFLFLASHSFLPPAHRSAYRSGARSGSRSLYRTVDGTLNGSIGPLDRSVRALNGAVGALYRSIGPLDGPVGPIGPVGFVSVMVVVMVVMAVVMVRVGVDGLVPVDAAVIASAVTEIVARGRCVAFAFGSFDDVVDLSFRDAVLFGGGDEFAALDIHDDFGLAVVDGETVAALQIAVRSGGEVRRPEKSGQACHTEKPVKCFFPVGFRDR